MAVDDCLLEAVFSSQKIQSSSTSSTQQHLSNISEETRGRSTLTPGIPIPKNRSTGNLLNIMSGDDVPNPSTHLRYSVDVANGVEGTARSAIVSEHEHNNHSGLRRIRQQPLMHPTAPSRSPSVAGLRSSSMQISLPSPSLVPSLGAGPTSPLFLEDLSRFPTESLHSFSFAQTDENRQTSHRGPNRWVSNEDADGSRNSGDSLDLSSSMVDLRDARKTSFLGGGFGPRTTSPERISTTTESRSHLATQPIPENTALSPTSTSPVVIKKVPKRPGGALKRTFTDLSGSRIPITIPENNFDSNKGITESVIGVSESPVISNFPSRSGTGSNHTRWVPAAQAIFTTLAKPPYTILSANDLACLVFGITKSEIGQIGILEVVQEERRAWLEKKLRYLDPTEAEKDEEARPNASAAAAAATALIGSTARIMTAGPPTPRRAQTVHNGDYSPPTTRGGSHHRNNLSRGVLICGDVVPIQKRNGNTGSASIWVKEKRVGLIWVVEEIHEDSATITLNAEGQVQKISGACKTIWNVELVPADTEINDLIPRIPRQGFTAREGPIDYNQVSRRHYYTCPHSPAVNIPCTVEQIHGTMDLRVSSFPHMAGIILVLPDTLIIKSTNSVFCGSLFGWEKADGKAISSLIPNFDKLLNILTEEDGMELVPGMVIPETSFRKAVALLALREHKPDAANAFLYPIGISGKHRDTSELKIDVQMRIITSEKTGDVRHMSMPEVDESNFDAVQAELAAVPQIETVYALWVTYSRHMHCTYGSPELPSTPPMNPMMSPLHQPSPGQLESRSPVDMQSDSDDTVSQLTPSQKPEVSVEKATEIPPLSLGKPVPPAAVVKQTPTKDETAAKTIEERTATTTTTVALAQPANTIPSAPTTPITLSYTPGSRAKATIDDYTILEEMGQGAYGQVKLARHNATGRKAVLKYVTKRRILVDTWTRDRRLGTVPLEIHVMSYLRKPEYTHPNIVEMECFFEDSINYYIEMVPHGLPGMDLFDYIELRASGMPEAECRSIFLQVARAIEHLHNVAKVVHRDIKDENVILDGKGHVKLIDFGSAAYIKSGPFSVFVGTIDYAAPEVLGGQQYNGKEQDVWALGILLYTIIYKENPFYNVDEITDHPLRIPWELSADSVDLIRGMLNRNVKERFTIDQVLAHPWMQLAIEESKAAEGQQQ